MAKITIQVPVEVDAEIDASGRFVVGAVQLPRCSDVEQEFLKLSTTKQVSIRAQLRAAWK